jgi:hypothetical protein
VGPGVIGDIDHKFRALVDKLPGKITKDSFKADQNSKLAESRVKDCESIAGGVPPSPPRLYDPSQEREEPIKGDGLTKRNQVNFGILIENLSFGREKKGAIIVVPMRFGSLQISVGSRCAEEEIGFSLVEECLYSLPDFGVKF